MKIIRLFSLLIFFSINISEREVSTNTTILNSDQIVTNIGGAVTFTMPTSPINGQEHTFLNYGTGDITLSIPIMVYKNTGINKIPPYSSQILPGWSGGNKMSVFFNGTNWKVK